MCSSDLSGAYDHIKELLAQNFIERRRQSDGRSYWLSLSEKFHRTFAVQGQDGWPSGQRRENPSHEQLELEANPSAESPAPVAELTTLPSEELQRDSAARPQAA